MSDDNSYKIVMPTSSRQLDYRRLDVAYLRDRVEMCVCSSIPGSSIRCRHLRYREVLPDVARRCIRCTDGSFVTANSLVAHFLTKCASVLVCRNTASLLHVTYVKGPSMDARPLADGRVLTTPLVLPLPSRRAPCKGVGLPSPYPFPSSPPFTLDSPFNGRVQRSGKENGSCKSLPCSPPHTRATSKGVNAWHVRTEMRVCVRPTRRLSPSGLERARNGNVNGKAK